MRVDCAIVERNLDTLPATTDVAIAECSGDRGRGIKARGHLADRKADRCWRLVGHAGDVHDTGCRLDEEIRIPFPCQRPTRSECGNMTNDLISAGRGHVLLPLWVEIGDDQDIGLGDEFAQQRAICNGRGADAELARDCKRALIPLAAGWRSMARLNDRDACTSLGQ